MYIARTQTQQMDGFFDVIGKIGSVVGKVAEAALPIYAQKSAQDAQVKIAQIQAAAAASAAIPPSSAAQYPPAPTPQMPDWIMPAAIAGGVSLLAILLLRK